MADFTKTAISQNAKREYISPIPTFEKFNEVIAAFTGDTSMGITKTKSSETYKTKIIYFDAASNEHGYALIYAATASELEEASSLFAGNEASETMAGIGGSASKDSRDDTWSVKFSCTNLVTVGSKEIEDIFTVTISKEYMSVTGFSYDETLSKIETWADGQTVLS